MFQTTNQISFLSSSGHGIPYFWTKAQKHNSSQFHFMPNTNDLKKSLKARWRVMDQGIFLTLCSLLV